MQDLLGFAAVIGVIAFGVIAVRFGIAFAKRLETRPPNSTSSDPALTEMRDAFEALQERVDFLERALVALKDQPGRALPVKGQRADSATTPV